ncbi:MAG: B12-binding domain-containing radical SAM protein [Roseiflexaceae bacterium]|nr:B12-binding domain-containing radical SAM protein [Roseiflexaceae bacterium]
MQKIVLYNPQAVFYTMPLGLLALASALDPARYQVQIIDGRLERDPVAAVLKATEGALCLGVTVLTGAPIRDALKISRAVKAQRPDLPVVWGGWHPSLFPVDTLAEPSVDISVQGQGEITFAEIVERLAAGASVAGLPGSASRSHGIPQLGPPRLMQAVNTLAPHRYDLIPVERYFGLKRQRQFDYISSAGCHFRCAFCADPFVYKRKWAGLDPARVGEELEQHWRRYQFEEVSFQDETFFTYRDRVIAIAEEFLRRGLRFAWTATMRADQGARLSEADMALCVRSGLRRVMIGVESGSQEMMDWLAKDIKIEQVLESAAKCVRHGVGVIFPFIVGFPGESDASVTATLEMIKRLRAMSPLFETPIFYFKPYPGSRITDEVVRQGYALPQTLEAWADFDFIGSSGPWVTPERERLIERFKFYNRFAGGSQSLLRWPLQQIARWRCANDFYALPVEKLVVERLRPLPKLS